jgi:hypothetical protein
LQKAVGSGNYFSDLARSVVSLLQHRMEDQQADRAVRIDSDVSA